MSLPECATLPLVPFREMQTTVQSPEPNAAVPQPTSKEALLHLAHELRQPLSALESIAYYLQLTHAGGSSVSPHVDRVQHLVDHANWVLSDMLNILQASTPAPAVVETAELVRDVLEEGWLTEGLAIKHQEEELPQVFFDCEQLRHLFRTVLYFLRAVIGQPREVAMTFAQRAGSLRVEFLAMAPSISLDALYPPLASKGLLACKHIAAQNGGAFAVSRDDRGWMTVHAELPLAEAN